MFHLHGRVASFEDRNSSCRTIAAGTKEIERLVPSGVNGVFTFVYYAGGSSGESSRARWRAEIFSSCERCDNDVYLQMYIHEKNTMKALLTAVIRCSGGPPPRVSLVPPLQVIHCERVRGHDRVSDHLLS